MKALKDMTKFELFAEMMTANGEKNKSRMKQIDAEIERRLTARKRHSQDCQCVDCNYGE